MAIGKRTEAAEQTAVITWAGYMQHRVPELALLYHVPNGGSRHEIEAVRLKAQGVKAGVPDLVLPVARGRFHGLYIELKAAGGRVSEAQEQWITDLNAQGYAALVCYGANEAISIIAKYMHGEPVTDRV